MSDIWSTFDTQGPAKIADAFRERQKEQARRNAMMQFAQNPDGAVQSLIGEGDITSAVALNTLQRQKQADAQAAQERQKTQLDEAQKKQLELVERTAKYLAGVRDKGGDVLGAFDNEVSPALTQLMQADPQQLGAIRGAIAQNPRVLDVIAQQAREKLEFRHVGEGYDVAIDPYTGTVKQEYRGPLTVGKTERLLMPDAAQPPAQVAPGASVAPTGASLMERPPEPPNATTPQGFTAFLSALRTAESNGRAGVAGQPTQYGTAHGTMQVLDSTGKAMAERLGVPWRPELMRGKTPEAVAYQDQIGRAYAQEAWEASGGDPRIAAMYYHGGPDRKQWGRRTRRHGDKVMANLGQVSGGAGADRMAGGGGPVVPGYTEVLGPEPEEKVRPATDAEKAAVGLRPEEPAQRFPNGEVKPMSTRDAGKTFEQEQKLRSQMGQLAEVKDFGAVKSHIATIEKISGKAMRGEPVSAADDMAMIFAFMKLLDPTSVVRESEYANAQNTAGIPDRVLNWFNQARTGQRLTDRQRAEFFRTAKLALESYHENYGDRAEQYRGFATSYGLNPDRIASKPGRTSRDRSRSRGGSQGVVTIDINGKPVR